VANIFILVEIFPPDNVATTQIYGELSFSPPTIALSTKLLKANCLNAWQAS
jgi:hypothetical protein